MVKALLCAAAGVIAVVWCTSAEASHEYPRHEVLTTGGWVMASTHDWTLPSGSESEFVWMRVKNFQHPNPALRKAELEILGVRVIDVYAVLDEAGAIATTWFRVDGHTFVAARFIAEPRIDEDGDITAMALTFYDDVRNVVFRRAWTRAFGATEIEKKAEKKRPRLEGP